MNCEIQDYPFTFIVESDNVAGKKYLVDLSARGEFGECSCEHFCCRIGPKLAKMEGAAPCKHIVEARLFLSRVVVGLALRANPRYRTQSAHESNTAP